MLLTDSSNNTHLSYCTNIHAGEAWPDVLQSLYEHVPTVRASVPDDTPFGLGLRVSASASKALQSHTAREELRSFLTKTNTYLFTINGFPYGTFHGQPVKEGAYKPDWTQPERLGYTNDLATLLAEFLPAQDTAGQPVQGSVSTVPGSYKPWINGDESKLALIAGQMVQHVAHLVSLKETTGNTIALALEPEPCCLLETIDETVDFFQQRLFSQAAQTQLSQLTGLSLTEANDALHTHIGVCYDVCHAAVEFENPIDSIRQLQHAGITIPKVQLSSALRLTNVTAASVNHLKPFAEPVYMHQVVEKNRRNELSRFNDLADAFRGGAIDAGSEWRVHFHVPVFLDTMEHFDTTQHFLKEILTLQAREPVTHHLEIETYSFNVLPQQYQQVSVAQAIAREMHWVQTQLADARV